MFFTNLSNYFAQLESTSSRLKKLDILSKMLVEGRDDVSSIIYLSEGRVVPFFENLEFNVGNALMQKAISDSTGKDTTYVIDEFSKRGDLGDVLYDLSKNKSESSLTVKDVFDRLTSIANTKGVNSTQTKIDNISLLLKESDSLSGRFIVRILLGKLRLGFSDRSILDALSIAISDDKKSRKVIENAYYKCSDLGYVANILFKDGIKGLEDIKLIPSIPVFPKLVERASSVEEVLKRIPVPIFQPKYDGMRAQIHLFESEGKKEVKIFSRRLEDLTPMFPDLVEEVKAMPFSSLILDSEVIGFNAETNEFFPFQETIQRKRKYNVAEISQQIPVISFVFDILHLNGEDLTEKILTERLNILKDVLSGRNKSMVRMSESLLMEESKMAEDYFMLCVEEGLEGIIAKDVNTMYTAGTRNFEWIKLKRASVSELNDTIDCVVLGYNFGYGQRAKFGIGALLVGIYNKDEDRYETIAKIGSGLKEDQLASLKGELDTLAVKNLPSNVWIDNKLMPDVLVDPKIVVVVRADEITKSPIHTAGKTDNSLGYALRFPRLIEIRQDKRPEDVMTLEEIPGIEKK